jgi:hypothetical protein
MKTMGSSQNGRPVAGQGCYAVAWGRCPRALRTRHRMDFSPIECWSIVHRSAAARRRVGAPGQPPGGSFKSRLSFATRLRIARTGHCGHQTRALPHLPSLLGMHTMAQRGGHPRRYLGPRSFPHRAGILESGDEHAHCDAHNRLTCPGPRCTRFSRLGPSWLKRWATVRTQLAI